MKRIFLITIFILSFSTIAFAEMTASNFGFKCIDNNPLYIRYSWKVDIESDEHHPDCVLYISFMDSDGYKITSTFEPVSITKGLNHYTDTDTCDHDIWKQIYKYEIEWRCRQ
jgi:hypothetical protein